MRPCPCFRVAVLAGAVLAVRGVAAQPVPKPAAPGLISRTNRLATVTNRGVATNVSPVTNVGAGTNERTLLHRLEKIRLSTKKVQFASDMYPELELLGPLGYARLDFPFRILRTEIRLATEYSFFDNRIAYGTGVEYFFYRSLSVGVEFFDRLEFEKLLEEDKYIQRRRGLEPFFAFDVADLIPALPGQRVRFSQSVRWEATYSASLQDVATNVRLDEGYNTTLRNVLSYHKLVLDAGLRKGHSIRLGLVSTFPFGDYDYTRFTFRSYSGFRIARYLGFSLNTIVAIPIEIGDLGIPATAEMTAGGQQVLRGFREKEFRGTTLVYLSPTLHFLLLTQPTREWYEMSIRGLRCFVFSDAAKIGAKADFEEFGYIPSSGGFGAALDFNATVSVPVSLGISVAQPYDERRSPRFYLSVETVFLRDRRDFGS